MRKIVLATLVLLLAIPAHAFACAPSDFTVKNFKMRVSNAGGRKRLKISGQLVNNCANPAGAKIKIVAKDARGGVVDSQSGWPTGSSNIPPGASVDFHLGALFTYDSSMKNFSAAIVSARTW